MALRAKSTEEITVSSSAIGVTAGLLVSDGAPTGVVMGVFQHASGGDIHINPINTPVAGDGDDMKKIARDIWEVWGFDDLQNFQMIKQTGASDAKVVVHLFGEG